MTTTTTKTPATVSSTTKKTKQTWTTATKTTSTTTTTTTTQRTSQKTTAQDYGKPESGRNIKVEPTGNVTKITRRKFLLVYFTISAFNLVLFLNRTSIYTIPAIKQKEN